MSTKKYRTTKTRTLPVIAAALAFFYVAIAGAVPNVSGASIGLTPSEISTHNSQSDCWMILGTKVYNVTSYLPYHPGGINAILNYCGKDAAAAFNAIGHSNNAQNLLASYYIGDVVINPPAPVPDTTLPTIALISPMNITYANATIPLKYTTVDTGSGVNTSACSYVLDIGAKNPLPNCANITLPTLANGAHKITVYSKDNAGNQNSVSVSFTVAVPVPPPIPAPDTTPPAVTIISPVNTTYATATILLKYTTSDTGSGINKSACNYKLDAKAITPLLNCANTTIPKVANGTHTVTVYSKDKAGNSGSASVSFTVNVSAPIPPPVITLPPVIPPNGTVSSGWTITSYQDDNEAVYTGVKTQVFDSKGKTLGFYKTDFLEQVKIDGSGKGDGIQNTGKYLHYDYNVDNGKTYYLADKSLGAYGNELVPWTGDKPSIAVNPPLPRGTKIRFINLGSDAKDNPAWVNELLLNKTFYADDKFSGETGKKIDIYVGLQKVKDTAGTPESLWMQNVTVSIEPPNTTLPNTLIPIQLPVITPPPVSSLNETNTPEQHPPKPKIRHKNYGRGDDELNDKENRSDDENKNPMSQKHNETKISKRIAQYNWDVLKMWIAKLHENRTINDD